MLCANAGMAHLAGFVYCQLDDALGARRQGRFAKRRAGVARRHPLDGPHHVGRRRAHLAQHARRNAMLLLRQAQQQMLGPDIIMIQPNRFFLRDLQDLARLLSETI